MPERSRPNLVLRRRLGAELRRLRELAGLTGEEVIGQLGWPSPSRLSRVEQGKSGLTARDLQSILTIYGIASAQRDELTALAEESRSQGTLPAAARRLPEEHLAFLQAEEQAESLWIWEPQIVPGLFQLDDYVRASLEPWNASFSRPPAELERLVIARRVRQDVLRRDPPIQIQVVMDESVLRRRVGDAALMNRQLKYLIEVSARPHIDLRVVELNGNHVIATGAFNYIRMRQAHKVLPVYEVVALDFLTSMSNIEDENEIIQYRHAFRELQKCALGPDESFTLIAAIADGTWS